jgi:hypothetical protein
MYPHTSVLIAGPPGSGKRRFLEALRKDWPGASRCPTEWDGRLTGIELQADSLVEVTQHWPPSFGRRPFSTTQRLVLGVRVLDPQGPPHRRQEALRLARGVIFMDDTRPERWLATQRAWQELLVDTRAAGYSSQTHALFSVSDLHSETPPPLVARGCRYSACTRCGEGVAACFRGVCWGVARTFRWQPPPIALPALPA